MKKISILFLLILALAVNVHAQLINDNTLTTENSRVTNNNGNVMLHTDLNFHNLDLGTQEMIRIIPVLMAPDSANMLQFDPIIIAGPVRYKALNRSLAFKNIHFEKNPQMILKYKKRSNQNYPLDLNFQYQEWMANSSLIFFEDVTGCACVKKSNRKHTVMFPVLPVMFVPKYEIAYITPDVEEVKRRSETYSARINFELNRYQILRNYKNNAQVLEEVDKIINEVRNDQNLTIEDFHITGYASPEGNPQSNLTLSKNRAEAFVSYLIQNYRISPTQIRTDWKGEDWDGLRKAVTESNMTDKAPVLEVLDIENVMTRKNRLKQISGGQTYRMMLNDLYPPLRRNDYTISYISKNFDVNEARTIIKTKPQQLSQNEMYQVANSYQRNSREFKETFDIIQRYYPDDETAIMNVSAQQIETGMYDQAINRLQNINKPEAWNNLGIAYYERKDYKRAGEYFRRAADAGLRAANYNLSQFNKHMQQINQVTY